MHHVTLNGQPMPALGFGTHELRGATCRDAVLEALSAGYRHVDTAAVYENEREVGAALRSSTVSRDEVFLTTKIWWDQLTRKRVFNSADHSLRRLGTDYVDLLLVHWPNPHVPLAETLDALKELQLAGKTRHIGVSNFPPALLDEARDLADVGCNQVEYHPFLSQQRVLDTARALEVVVTAYSPLAQGAVLQEATIQRIAAEHRRTAPQVTLRWLLQQPAVAAIPRSADPAHIRSNLEVFDFELTDEEVSEINGLARGQRLIDPEFAPQWEGPRAELTRTPLQEAPHA